MKGRKPKTFTFLGFTHYCSHDRNGKFWVMMKSLLKWLNQGSQKKSYNWEGFNDMLKMYPLATPKIYVNMYAR